jgi:LysM repeat protein
MATITISAPVSRRTVVERRPVASTRRAPITRKTVQRTETVPAASVLSNVVIPEAATVYAAGGSPVHPEPVAARATTRTSSPVRLTTRGRRLARTAVVLLALLAALAFSISSHSAASQAGDGPAVSATTTVVVQPGQTLWSVARGLSTDVDVRETVARIQELNGLTGTTASTVLPGQSLIVPVLG